jgi:hypothetical protein
MPFDAAQDDKGQVTVSFEYKKTEFIRALRGVLVRRTSFKVMSGCGFSCLVAGALLVGELASFGVILLAAGLTDLALAFGVVIIVSGQTWNKMPDLHDQRSFVFCDESIEISGATTYMKNQWSRYSHTVENPDWYALRVTGSSAYVFLPKRGFSSHADELAFRELVQRHTEARLRPLPTVWPT